MSALPDDSELPEELLAPVPRQVPEAVKYGQFAHRGCNLTWGISTAGVVCIACDALLFMDVLALYIIPLAYLLWIGLGLCSIGALGFVLNTGLKKRCRYIEHGEAAFGRVVRLV